MTVMYLHNSPDMRRPVAIGAGIIGGAPVALAAVIGNSRHAEEIILPADRGRLRDFAVISLLNLLRKALAA